MSVFGGIASVVGAIGGARAADNAEDAFQTSQRDSRRESRRAEGISRELQFPFYNTGTDAQAALNQTLGLGPQAYVGGVAPEVVEESFEVSTPDNRTQLQLLRDRERRQPSTSTQRRFRVGEQTFNTRHEAERYARENPINQQAFEYTAPATDLASYGWTEDQQNLLTPANPEDYTMRSLDINQLYDDFQESPDFQFRRDRGLEAVQASMGGRFGLNSGATQAALNDYAAGSASDEFDRYYGRRVNERNFDADQNRMRYGINIDNQNLLRGERSFAGGERAFAIGERDNLQNRLTGLSTAGQNAANATQNAVALGSTQMQQSYANTGNVGAAAAVQRGNVFSNAVEQLAGPAQSAWNYGRNQGWWGSGSNPLAG